MSEQSAQPDGAEADWRELLRCDDRARAIGVTTTIAAMGFDVECEDSGGTRASCPSGCGTGGPALGEPPYVIRVPAANLAELGAVLEEIISEQAEFDQRLAQRDQLGRRLRRRFMLTVLIVVMLLLGLLGLLQV